MVGWHAREQAKSPPHSAVTKGREKRYGSLTAVSGSSAYQYSGARASEEARSASAVCVWGAGAVTRIGKTDRLYSTRGCESRWGWDPGVPHPIVPQPAPIRYPIHLGECPEWITADEKDAPAVSASDARPVRTHVIVGRDPRRSGG